MVHASFLQAAIALLTSNNDNSSSGSSIRRSGQSSSSSSRRRPLPTCAKDRQISAASAIDSEKEKKEKEKKEKEQQQAEEGHEASCSSPPSEWAILLIPSTFPRPSRSMHKAASATASVITTLQAQPKGTRLPHQASWIKAHRKLQASSAKASPCTVLLLLSLWILILILILATTNGHSPAYNSTIHGSRSGLSPPPPPKPEEHGNSQNASDLALHGLGLVLREGSRAMENLIIASVEESCGLLDFRLFLRTLFRSGAMANADLVLLFPWPSTAIAEPFRRTVCEEDRSFHRFMRSFADPPATTTTTTTRYSDDGPRLSVSDPAAFMAVQASENSHPNIIIKRVNGHGTPSPSSSSSLPSPSPSSSSSSLPHRHGDGRRSGVWGNHHRTPSSSRDRDLPSAAICNQSSALSAHSDQGNGDFKFGSVIGFQIDELDSIDGFVGFLAHHRSSRLRRWLCYQMLLGLLRTKFAQVLLVELGGVLILSDVFQHPKRKEFLHLTTRDSTWEEATSPQPAAHGSGKSPELSVQRNPETAHYDDEMPRKIDRHGVKEIDAALDKLNEPRPSMKRAGEETMFEILYGKELWKSLEKWEKEQRMVSSRVMLGSMRATKSLVNSMVLEIVRTLSSLKKGVSAPEFDDEVLLSYLVQKCPHSLGRTAAENLAVFSNGDSISHCLDGSKQEHVFHRSSDQQKFSILQASSLNVSRYQGSHLDIAQLIMYDICSSSISSSAYDDCWKYR